MTRAPASPWVLDPQAYPLLRPQVTCLDDDVYFGSHYLARITPQEAGFLRLCDGQLSLAAAAREAAIDAIGVARLASWLLWWGEPPAGARDTGTRIDRIVFSTTAADAWLGMGGRLLAEAADCPTLLITCFGSVGTTPLPEAYPTPAEAALACRDEAALAARLARVGQRVWEFPDAAIRASLAARGHDLEATIADALRARVLDVVDALQPSDVFVPAGLGASPDARLLFETLLSTYADGTLAPELHAYEDMPVTKGYRPIDEFCARFERSYLSPREYSVDVTPTAVSKPSLVDAFRCSVDGRRLRPWTRSAARNALLAGYAPGRLAERFWQIGMAAIETA